MNSTIHNTNVEEIKKEISELIKELQQNQYIQVKKQHHEDKDDPMFTYLKKKYSNISTTSKSLFMLILSETNKPNFHKESFDKKINEILLLISRIQKSEITQDDASKQVGEMLANEFIPSNLRSPQDA
jgi:Asp-tRNA(Asn)/Glu-tRNA(Gln) amidotransferase B subunit